MKNRKTIALLLLIIGIALSIAFLMKIEFPQGFEAYFKREYYYQFGDVKKLCMKSQNLGPLSKRPGFNNALMTLKTIDKDSVTLEEFNRFCVVGFKGK